MPPRLLYLLSNDSPNASTFLHQLAHELGEAMFADTVDEARKLLGFREDIEVVITASTLPDGNWISVLKAIIKAGSRAELIIVARDGGGALRMTAKTRGVFGVLAEPLHAEALRTLVRQAAERARTETIQPAGREVRVTGD